MTDRSTTPPTSPNAKLERMAETNPPLSAHLGLRVSILEPGNVEVSLPQSVESSNTFGSIHAVALVAAAETASGIALLSRLGVDMGAPIAKSLSVRYLRPAKGEVRACADLPPDVSAVDGNSKSTHDMSVVVVDGNDVVVAEVDVQWVWVPAQPST
jgi:uncharacterized protein (TIGR00369 family)